MEVHSSLPTNPLLLATTSMTSVTTLVSNAGDSSSNNHNMNTEKSGDGQQSLGISPSSSNSEIEKELRDIQLNCVKSLNGSGTSLSYMGLSHSKCKSNNGSLSGTSYGSMTGGNRNKQVHQISGDLTASGSGLNSDGGGDIALIHKSPDHANGNGAGVNNAGCLPNDVMVYSPIIENTSAAAAAAQLKKRILNSRTPTRKARRIKFYRNGDRFYPGITIPVSNERYRSFESLFEDLTRLLEENVKIPGAVRTIYTMCGKKIGSLEDLEDGLSYVCSCNNEYFKKIEYNTTSQPLPNLNASTKANNRLSKVLRPSSPMKSSTNGERLIGGSGVVGGTGSPVTIQSSVVFPRIVTLIRNGTKPRKIMRLLLNKRNSPTYDHVLTAITQVVRLDTYVRKVFTLTGSPVLQLSDFFGPDDVFFAYGTERVSYTDDFKLEPEEQKAIQSIRKTLRTVSTTCEGPKPKMPIKKSKNIKSNAPGCRMIAQVSEIAKASVEATTKSLKASSSISGNCGSKENDLRNNVLTIEEAATTGINDSGIDIDDLPQSIRERYSLGSVIGDGNFAVVLKIKDRNSGHSLALKIIDKSKCKGKEHYIDAEVRVMKKLQHPHIISLIMDVDQQENMFLVLEYVSGGDLFDAITRVTRFSEDQSRVMIRHLASAMAYLHSMSIVHRDIKPENLLVELDHKGNVIELKLADFGLACEVNEPLFAVCGTPTYVAPEILMETGYDLKIDVWAAGIILYILLCGFPPFVSPDNEQEPLFDAIIKGVYEFPEPYWSDIGDGVRDLINNMLQSDPEVRFTSEDILDHYWTMEGGEFCEEYSS